MTEISLLFELSDETAVEQTTHTLQERLGDLAMVEEVETYPVGPMRLTGVEIAAAIGVTVLIVRGSRELIGEIRQLVSELKGLLQESRELKEVWLDVGPKRVPLDELTEEELLELAT